MKTNDETEMLEEYDFTGGVRGKYVDRVAKSKNMIVLEPDVGGIFTDGFVKEMRIAAAVKWYELGRLSQGKAAEVAGLSRSAFIEALSRFKVSPI